MDEGQRRVKYIGIVGSRKRDSDYDFLCCVDHFLEIFEEGDIIVSGGCPLGGDNFAEIIAEAYDVEIEIFHPDWEKHGKKAGFLRNLDIAKKSDVLIAILTEDKSQSKGTMHTVNTMCKLNKPVILNDCEEEFNPEDIC